jgi:AcrR family transcriptional regulator
LSPSADPFSQEAGEPSQADRHPAAAASAERGRETKERLLDAAERLFAERGFEGTSVREVTQAAATSVSAANYHFGSKLALLRETLRRRVEPINARRMAQLDALERDAAGRGLTVEEIIDAWLRPLFEERATRTEATATVRFVAARLYAERPALVATLKKELFGPVSDRFLPALARALPGRRQEEIGVGFQFVVGLMVHVMSGNLADAPGLAGMRGHAGGPASSRDVHYDEVLLQHMISFAAAGLRAKPGDAP